MIDGIKKIQLKKTSNEKEIVIKKIKIKMNIKHLFYWNGKSITWDKEREKRDEKKTSS